MFCFQEALPPFIDHFRQQAWTQHYQFSDYQGIIAYISEFNDLNCCVDFTGKTVRPYGVFMLVRKTLVPTFAFHDFPTGMDRKLLVADLNLDMGQTFQVGTVHLESLLGNPELRGQQLEISNRVLRASNSAILCGDFNCCSYRNYSKKAPRLENSHLPTRLPGYTDVWEDMYPASVDRDRQLPSTEEIRTGISSGADTIVDPGFTFDSETNPMLHSYEQMRYDRIMLRSRRWQAVDIQILGRDPIVFDILNGKPVAVPSDHYGLVATLQLVDDTGRRTPEAEVNTGDPFLTPPSKNCDYCRFSR